MVILLYEFTCINLHDKLFYPLRTRISEEIRKDSMFDRYNLYPILWIVSMSLIVITGMPFTHHTHGCHCAIVIAWMDVYCQFLAARSVGHCHWMGQLIRAHATVLSPDSNRSNWLQSLGLITRSNDWLSTMDRIARF